MGLRLSLSGLRLAALVAGLGLVACGGASVHVELDPLHVDRLMVGQTPVAVIREPEPLFEEGTRSFEAGEHLRAARLYLYLVERFPTSPLAGPARYNGALSLKRHGSWEEAAALFGDLAAVAPGPQDRRDALFHRVACLRELERWGEVERTVRPMLEQSDPGPSLLERLDARAFEGEALHRLGRLAAAERSYKGVIQLHRKNLELPGVDRHPGVSLAMVGMGEIYRGLFEAISFRLPMERMAQDLEDKSNLFLKAQSAYMRALRQRHPDWAPRAGYRLGALYERMYDDMVAADVPPELTPEQVEVYRATLRARVRPLIEQAIDIYDRNLMMARSLGADQAWLERSRAGLARLRRVLEE